MRRGSSRGMEQFLAVADRHKIGVVFVLFDGVWDPFPQLGKQRPPKPGVHNSGWVQSPGAKVLQDASQHEVCESLRHGVVGHFKADRRIHAWDLFNEPDNPNRSSYGRLEPATRPSWPWPCSRRRSPGRGRVDPAQPLTAGVWAGDWSTPKKLSPINRYMLTQSDVISFHNYRPLAELKKDVESLKRYHRPMLCTEYMARPAGSTFDPILAYLKEERIGAYNWGFVAGKTQTIYPWDSWQKAYAAEPAVWFHDIFRPDGKPYDAREVAFIRAVTGKAAPASDHGSRNLPTDLGRHSGAEPVSDGRVPHAARRRLAAPDVLRWKYLEPHEPGDGESGDAAPRPRAAISRATKQGDHRPSGALPDGVRGSGLAAHGGQASTIHIIDWLGSPDHRAVGTSLMRKAHEEVATQFGLGVSQAACRR